MDEGKKERKDGREWQKGRGSKTAISTLWVLLPAPDNNVCRFGVLEILVWYVVLYVI